MMVLGVKRNGVLTHRRQSDGAPHPDGALKNAARSKILDYRRLSRSHCFHAYGSEHFGPLLSRLCRLLFLHAHREAAALAREIPESDQFRFLRTACLGNLKGSVGISRFDAF